MALLADYTQFPDNITDELKKFQRAGVPMVVVYSKNPAAQPEVFDVVTPGTVVSALERAAQGSATPLAAGKP